MAKYKKNDRELSNKIGAEYAKNPTPEKAAELIQIFGPFIEKYVAILSPDRKVNAKDGLSSETKQFLYLFRPKNSTGKQDYQATLNRIPNMAVQSLLTDDDIYQSIVVIFLGLAQKFDQSKCGTGTFTGYINNFMKFNVRSLIFESHYDSAKYQTKHQPPIEEVFEDDKYFFGYNIEVHQHGITVNNHNIKIVKNRLTETTFEIPMLTDAFVSNPIAPFDVLWSKQVRLVMIKRYRDEMSWSAIANYMGYTTAATIRDMHDDAIAEYKRYIANRSE